MKTNWDHRIPIYYVDAPAGFGKTFHAVDYSLEQMKLGQKVLIIFKTIALINEQFERARTLAGDMANQVRRFNGDGKKLNGSVKRQIKSHLEKTPSGIGELIFVTEAAMLSLRYFPKPHNWIVIFDEIPAVDNSQIGFNSPDNHTTITDCLSASASKNGYLTLRPKNSAARRRLEMIGRNPRRDDGWKPFMNCASHVSSKDYEVFISESVWAEHSQRRKKPKSKFRAHAVLCPKRFREFHRVIIMGAMFTESLLYQIWSLRWNQCVQFIPFTDIQSKLGTGRHKLNGKLTVKYLTDGQWSKTQVKKAAGSDGKTILAHAVEIVASEFKGKEFLYSVNKNTEVKFENAHRLSGSPYGINTFQHISRGAFLSAINPTPKTCRFYQALGLSSAGIKKAFMFQHCYQALMRSSLRNVASSEDVEIIVPSKDIADWFVTFFEGNLTVQKIAGLPELQADETYPSMSDAQRQDKCRRGKWLKEIRDLENGSNPSSMDIENISSLNRSVVTNQTDLEMPLKIQFFGNVTERPLPENFHSFSSWDHFFEELRDCSTRTVSEKHSNFAISPATFGDKCIGGKRTRRLENITCCSCLILDRDEGELTPEDFKRIFPNVKMCLYNSQGGNGRFRIVIPLSKKIPAEAYTDICRSIRAIIEKSGFVRDSKSGNGPRHGLDEQMFSPTSVLYAPCLPNSGKEEDRLFEVVEGQLLDPEPLILNPKHSEIKTFNQRNMKAFQQQIKSCTNKAKEASRSIEDLACIQEYKDLPPHSGQSGIRRAEFLKLGRKLKNHGLPRHKVIEKLYEADHDEARAKNNDIEKVMTTLDESPWISD